MRSVPIPEKDRRDPYQYHFALQSPDTMFFERRLPVFFSLARDYRPLHGIDIHIDGEWLSLSERTIEGQAKPLTYFCEREDDNKSSFALNGPEVAALLVAYRPFQYENIFGFSSDDIPRLRVITDNTTVDGVPAIILRGTTQADPRPGRQLELAVRRDSTFLPLHWIVTRDGKTQIRTRIRYAAHSDKISWWHAQSWRIRDNQVVCDVTARIELFSRNESIPAELFQMRWPDHCPRSITLAEMQQQLSVVSARPRRLFPWLMIAAGVFVLVVAWRVWHRAQTN